MPDVSLMRYVCDPHPPIFLPSVSEPEPCFIQASAKDTDRPLKLPKQPKAPGVSKAGRCPSQ